MFSFTQENRRSLVDFFHEAVASRKKSIFHPEGCRLSKWSTDQQKKNRLQSLCPVLNEASLVLEGIHALAYMFDTCVVKTNVFDQYYHDGQMSWLKWCVTNQHNPMVPKIAFLITDVETERFLVVMERLDPHAGFKDHSFSEEIDTALKTWMSKLSAGPAFRKLRLRYLAEAQESITELRIDIEMLQADGDTEISAAFEVAIAQHEIAITYINQLNKLDKAVNHHQKRHFKDIRNKFSAAACTGQVIDVHACNWMLRQNQPVFLDPIN